MPSSNFSAWVITARPPNITRRAAWLLSETNSAAVSVAPLERKEIGDFFNLGKRTEPEQGGSDTMPSSLRLARRVDHRLDALLIGRGKQHSEIRPAEFPLMLLGSMRGKIHPHLALDAGLLRIGASDGHRAAVDLHHEIAPRA